MWKTFLMGSAPFIVMALLAGQMLSEGFPQASNDDIGMSHGPSPFGLPIGDHEVSQKLSEWFETGKKLVQTIVLKTEEAGIKTKSENFKEKANKFVEENIEEISDFAKKVQMRTQALSNSSDDPFNLPANVTADASLGILNDLANLAQKLKLNITSD